MGYLLGGEVIRVDTSMISPIKDFPQLKSAKQFRRFLGMADWYRRFIRDYSTLSAPIIDCLKKQSGFTWTESVDEAFHTLKKAVSTAHVLSHPNFKEQGDAAKVAVANGENEGPIAFIAQKLNRAQKNFAITRIKLEYMAAVLTVKQFRAYVEGHQFTSGLCMSQSDLSGLQAFEKRPQKSVSQRGS